MGAFDRWFDVGARGGPQQVSNRVLTVPNLLSFARLAALPLIYLDLVTGRLLRALVLLAVFAATDWFDGYVARRFDQITRVGQLLDPLSDRALFIVVGVGFVVGNVLPLWAVLVLFVRDGLVLLGAAFLVVRGSRPPAVTRLGKAATFGLMVTLPFFLGAAVIGDGTSAPQPVLQALAWAGFAVNATMYWIAAVGYLVALRSPNEVE